MNNISFVETENTEYEYIFPICTCCQLFIKKKLIHSDKSYMIANGYDFGSVEVFDILDTKTTKEDSQQSFQSQDQNNIPYYQKYNSLSDALFLNVVDNAFITPSRIYGQVLKLTGGNNAGSGMLALKAHMICFENLYESKLPLPSNNQQGQPDILPNYESLKQNVYEALFIGSEEKFEQIKNTGTEFKAILNKLCIIHIERCKLIMNILRQVLLLLLLLLILLLLL
jgi:hypothetical protein